MEKLTNKKVLAIWWAWQWRVAVATIVATSIFTFMIGFIGSLFGLSKENIYIISNLVSIGIGVYASIYFLKFALQKKYRDFSIKIEPETECICENVEDSVQYNEFLGKTASKK
ncbi:hypothetical protein [Nitrosophilus alvini]|uniref:hypothetical protein n=1 Tax=Nitrosophilus alvini TaxID=2714855 RepID=UPI00190D9221|nr:hypothetical protein [Nitrosophilus alvini]